MLLLTGGNLEQDWTHGVDESQSKGELGKRGGQRGEEQRKREKHTAKQPVKRLDTVSHKVFFLYFYFVLYCRGKK